MLFRKKHPPQIRLLSETPPISLRLECTSSAGRTVEFAVILVLKENGKNIELVKYDNAHGPGHRHLDYLPASDKRRLKRMDPADARTQQNQARDDLQSNWQKYYQHYLNFRYETQTTNP